MSCTAVSALSFTDLIASPIVPLPVPAIPWVGSATVTLPVAGSIVASGPIKSFTLFATLYNWLPLTASLLVGVTAPGATLVIFLSPASIPSFFTEGPPAMVKPSVFNVLSPAVTCVKLMLSLSENSTVAPSAALVCFAFKFLPAWRVTLLPALIFWSAWEAASNSPSVALVSTTKWVFASACATVPAVTNLPLSAGVAGAVMLPSASTKSPLSLGVTVTMLVFGSLTALNAFSSPDFTSCTAVSAFAFTPSNLVLVAWSCEPFTASWLFAETSPALTPEITLLPASIPPRVTLGPPVMVKPLVFTVVLPAVTEVTSRSSFVATVYSSPPAAFLPFVTFTFLPSTTVVCFAAVAFTALIASPILSLPVPPIPWVGSATETLPVAGSIFASGPTRSATFFATSYNWPPFTASLLVGVTAPGATLVIFLSFAFKPSLLM